MVLPDPGNTAPKEYLPKYFLNECIQATTHISNMKKNKKQKNPPHQRFISLFPQIITSHSSVDLVKIP